MQTVNIYAKASNYLLRSCTCCVRGGNRVVPPPGVLIVGPNAECQEAAFKLDLAD